MNLIVHLAAEFAFPDLFGVFKTELASCMIQETFHVIYLTYLKNWIKKGHPDISRYLQSISKPDTRIKKSMQFSGKREKYRPKLAAKGYWWHKWVTILKDISFVFQPLIFPLLISNLISPPFSSLKLLNEFVITMRSERHYESNCALNSI